MSKLKPSEKALREAGNRWKKSYTLLEMLEAAYTIDVDPLLTQKDTEIERLTNDRFPNEKLEADWEQALKRIIELEEKLAAESLENRENFRLIQQLEEENEHKHILGDNLLAAADEYKDAAEAKIKQLEEELEHWKSYHA